MTRGGARPGAGRKPRNPAGARVYKTLRLDPLTDATVRAHLVAGETYATVLDRIVREWAARAD